MEERSNDGQSLPAFDALREAFAQSHAQVHLEDVDAVRQAFAIPQVGVPSKHLADRIRALVVSDEPTGFDTHDVRDVIGVFHLHEIVAGECAGYACIAAQILSPISAGTWLKLPTDPAWIEAASLGRGLSVLDRYIHFDDRHLAVAHAARRLKDQGFDVRLNATGIDLSSSLLADVTQAIASRFERLGLVDSLTQVCASARAVHPYAYGQYLFGRKSTHVPGREPSIPFGFLLNLAVRASDHPGSSADRADDWKQCVLLSRDVVAVLDVETYSQFWMLNSTPQRMGAMLREIGLYDHLFGARQWSLAATPTLLGAFFGPCDAQMKEKLGWGVPEAIAFSQAIQVSTQFDPSRITKADLLLTGIEPRVLDAMLPYFVHPAGQVNNAYLSPAAATSADLLFRPLIEANGGSFVVPSASLTGPACYEAVLAAVRSKLPSGEMSKLSGEGTERAVAAVLRARGLAPSFEGAKYNEGAAVDAGECDLVLESDRHILFIECKAKPLTRATMAAEPGAALLDYGGGLIASQTQALQHERILRQNGAIAFDDGTRLEHRGREVMRLSVTLLDHGSLQDRFLFANLVETLLRAQVEFAEDHPKKKQLRELNKLLDLHRKVMSDGNAIKGVTPWQEALDAASLSVGQLAVLVEDAGSVDELIEILGFRASYVTTNPLLEYYHSRTLLQAKRSKASAVNEEPQ